MTPDDRERFGVALFTLSEVFKDPMTPLRLEGYWMALEDLTIEQVELGASRCMRGSAFFPRPVAIREAVLGNPADATETAWMVWKLAATRVGAGVSLFVDDAALAETLIAVFGGWPEACVIELSPEMWAAKRKEFDRVYHVMLGRQLTGPRYLLGNHERHNQELAELGRFTPVAPIEGVTVAQLSLDEATRRTLALAHAQPQLTSGGSS